MEVIEQGQGVRKVTVRETQTQHSRVNCHKHTVTNLSSSGARVTLQLQASGGR